MRYERLAKADLAAAAAGLGRQRNDDEPDGTWPLPELLGHREELQQRRNSSI